MSSVKKLLSSFAKAIINDLKAIPQAPVKLFNLLMQNKLIASIPGLAYLSASIIAIPLVICAFAVILAIRLAILPFQLLFAARRDLFSSTSEKSRAVNHDDYAAQDNYDYEADSYSQDEAPRHHSNPVFSTPKMKPSHSKCNNECFENDNYAAPKP